MIININPIAARVCVLITLATLSMTSCVYDSREEISALEPCDTSSATFQLNIKPILSNNCIVCHSGESPANGLDYTKYSDVLIVASDGRLAGAINHRPGFEPMPRFAPKLPSCEIQKIEKWISEGALNN